MRLLIVEDQNMIRRGLCKMAMEVPDTVVESACDGEEALKKYYQCPFDAMFTDIEMPEKNGLKLIKKLYNIKPEGKFGIISGFDRFDYAREAMGFGVKDYLLKPICREQFHECILRFRKEVEEESEKANRYIEACFTAANKQAYPPVSITPKQLQGDRLLLWVFNQLSSPKKLAMLPLLTPMNCPCADGNFYLVHKASLMKEQLLALSRHQAALIPLESTEGTTAAFSAILSSQKDSTSHVVQMVLKLIDMRYAENITLTQISSEVYLHPNYLSTLFRKTMKCGFTDYLNQVRIEKSKHLLLKSSQHVYTVANNVGFNDARYFAVVFKKITGQTPQEYRNQYRGSKPDQIYL